MKKHKIFSVSLTREAAEMLKRIRKKNYYNLSNAASERVLEDAKKMKVK